MNLNLEDLYVKFVLLDLMAKVAPGAFFIISTFLAVVAIGVENSQPILRTYNNLFTNILTDVSVWTFIIFIVFSWVVGFAIQCLGEWIGIIKYGWDDEDKPTASGFRLYFIARPNPTPFERKTVEFNKVATNDQKIRYQRLVAIKEACGNMSIALGLSGILLLGSVHFSSYTLGYFLSPKIVPLAAAYILLMLLLMTMHIKHRERQEKYWEIVMTNVKRGSEPSETRFFVVSVMK